MFAAPLAHRTTRARRSAAATALAALAAVPLLVLLSVTPATWAAATAPGADAGALLAGLAALAGWVVAIRLLVTALAVSIAALPGAAGRTGHRIAAAWSPALVRGLVRAALGAAVVSGPLIAGTAAFAEQPAFPTLDRVIAVPAGPTPVHLARHLPAATVHRSSGNVVVVRPGDSLWEIAASHLPAGHTDAQVARAWPRWYAANRQSIGADPGQIRPGTRLVPPSPTS